MEKKQKRGKQELPSLIPSVKSEEKHLAELLVTAGSDASACIREAEAAAEESVRLAREQMPQKLKDERAQRLATMKKLTEEELGRARTLIAQTEGEAAGRMEEAVRRIVSLVWPGARP
ncbi:MAG: V-type ATPase subunit subunit G family protein [Spirochaetia bacterium]|jgi:hypothetical protein